MVSKLTTGLRFAWNKVVIARGDDHGVRRQTLRCVHRHDLHLVLFDHSFRLVERSPTAMESLLKVVQRRFFGLVGDEFEQQQLHLVSVVSWGPFKCFKDACQTFVGRGSESLGKIVQKPVDGCNLASDRLLRRCSSV